MTETRIKLQRRDASGLTCVPNLFIDKYMTKAPGEYVKVYLYLLRCLNGQDAGFSMEQMALLFDSTEGDIRRAIAYWEKEGLLRLTYSEGQLVSVSMDIGGRSAESKPSSSADVVPFYQEIPNYSIQEIREFLEDDEIRQLQFVAESYLNRPLTQKDVAFLLFWMKSLGFTPDLTICLIEQQVSQGHTSFRTMNRTAIKWYQDGICTPEDVRNLNRCAREEQSTDELEKKIKEVFHLTNRKFSNSEKTFLHRWIKTWHFSEELILEACTRTYTNTNQASFAYADKILSNWHRQKIATMDAVEESDAAFLGKNAARAAEKGTVPDKAKTTSFHNFSERKSNYRELENLLLSGS